MSPTKSYVKTTIDLDKENLDSFKSILPMRGSIRWFVNACLARFVEVHKLEPSLDEEAKIIVDEVLETTFEGGEEDD